MNERDATPLGAAVRRAAVQFGWGLAVTAALVGAMPACVRAAPATSAGGAIVLFCAMDAKHLAGESFVRPRLLLQQEHEPDLGLGDTEKARLAEIDEQVYGALIGPHASGGGAGNYEFIRRGVEDLRRRVAEALRPEQLARVKALIARTYGLWIIPLDDLRRLLRLERNQVTAIHDLRERALSEINSSLDRPARAGAESPCRVVSGGDPGVRRILERSDRATMAVLSKEQSSFVQRMKAGLPP